MNVLSNPVAVGVMMMMMRGGRCRVIRLEKLWCFGLAVAYVRWSLTRDGRTWRFDCISL